MQIGTGEYRLCGVDTNIYSNLLKEPRLYIPALTKLLDEAPSLLCFSPYTLYELRAHPDLFAAFVELFDLFPCAILKNEEMLIADEAASYATGSIVDPLLFGFSYLNKSRGTNLRNLLDAVLAKPNIAKRELEWPLLKKEILASWIALKPNFPPRGRTYTLLEAKDFARRVTAQQVAGYEPMFYRSVLDSGAAIDANRFPSLMMSSRRVLSRLRASREKADSKRCVRRTHFSTDALSGCCNHRGNAVRHHSQDEASHAVDRPSNGLFAA